jgi:hypothetical protein
MLELNKLSAGQEAAHSFDFGHSVSRPLISRIADVYIEVHRDFSLC